MSNNKYFPAQHAIEKVIYMEGNPLSYKLSAKDGALYKGDIKIADGEFTFIPIAYRIFRAALWPTVYGDRAKDWCEFYFQNNFGAICSFLIGGESVVAIKDFIVQELYYDEKDILHKIIRVSSNKKETSKQVDGKTSKYSYFTFKLTLEGEAEGDFGVLDGEVIYRKDTLAKGTITTASSLYQISENDMRLLE